MCVVGGGSFGTSIALLAARNNHDVVIYMRDPVAAESVNQQHSSKYFDNILLPVNITATSDLTMVFQGVDIIFLALPTQIVSHFSLVT